MDLPKSYLGIGLQSILYSGFCSSTTVKVGIGHRNPGCYVAARKTKCYGFSWQVTKSFAAAEGAINNRCRKQTKVRIRTCLRCILNGLADRPTASDHLS